MERSEREQYYAVHIPSPDGGASSDGAVFLTLKEASNFANTPESKSKGARFKRFMSPDDAKNYAENGDIFCKSPETTVGKQILGEPSVSFPSVSRIMLNRLKKSIETKDDALFMDMVSQNPRYLINVGSDTPTIVVEGFRYNAMHLAAKVGNLYVAKYVLHLVCDSEALLALYDTSENDVKMRSRVLLDCYLNMPDKGSHDTPLHFASKFGHYGLVELILSYSVCQKNLTNKMDLTPAQVCCTRYNGADKGHLRDVILPLFSAFFVALYRPTDNYYSATILVFDEVPPNPLPDAGPGSAIHLPTFEVCELAAYAGPFADEAQAQKFCGTWKAGERECRRSQPRKGAERIGRRLAYGYKVNWLERWSFSDKLIDLQSCAGLEELNRYLVYIRLHPPSSASRSVTFDDDDDDSYFADASEIMDKSDANFDAAVTDDSCGGITRMMANLKLDSDTASPFNLGDNPSKMGIIGEAVLVEPRPASGSAIGLSGEQQESTSDDDDFDYHTPPSSPEPVYIFEGIPSKDDEELAIALSLVDQQLIQRFCAVAEYVRHVRNVPKSERSQWPSTDSPRAKRRKI